MGQLGQYKAKAATLFEALVALVILSVVFVITSTVFVKVSAGPVSMKKLIANGVLMAYSDKVIRNKLFFDNDERVDSFEIRRVVTTNENCTNLWAIHYYIFDNSKTLLSEWQQYVLSGQ